MGPDLGAHAAAAPRLRGPGPRALVGPHRAVPDAGRRGQHPGLQRHDRGAVLPPAAPADAAHGAQAARSCSRPKSLLRAKVSRSPIEELDARVVPGGPRRPRRHRRRRRRGASGSCSPRARSPTTPSRPATSSAPRSPSPGSSSCSRGRSPAWPRCSTRYPNADQIFWLQEEPENMGPWNAIKGRLYEAHGTTHWIHRVSRSESGSPATGSHAIHLQEQEEVVAKIFEGLDPSVTLRLAATPRPRSSLTQTRPQSPVEPRSTANGRHRCSCTSTTVCRKRLTGRSQRWRTSDARARSHRPRTRRAAARRLLPDAGCEPTASPPTARPRCSSAALVVPLSTRGPRHRAAPPRTVNEHAIAAVLDVPGRTRLSHDVGGRCWGLPGLRRATARAHRRLDRSADARPSSLATRPHDDAPARRARHRRRRAPRSPSRCGRSSTSPAGCIPTGWRGSSTRPGAMRLVTGRLLRRTLAELAEHGRPGIQLMRALIEDRGDDYRPPDSNLEARFEKLDGSDRHHDASSARSTSGGDRLGRTGRLPRSASSRSSSRSTARTFHLSLTDQADDERRRRRSRTPASSWSAIATSTSGTALGRRCDAPDRDARAATVRRCRCTTIRQQRLTCRPMTDPTCVRTGA